MFSMYDYIEKNAKKTDCSKKDNKSLYFNLIKKSIAHYDFDKLKRASQNPESDFLYLLKGYTRIAVARIINVLAFHMANGLHSDKYDLWCRLLDISVKDLRTPPYGNGADFIAKELVTALYIMKDNIEKDRYEKWIKELKKVDPFTLYDNSIQHKPNEKLHNFNIYGMCGEYLREYLGAGDANEFINTHWPIQKQKFDENGMYKDPNCPMLYDLTSRYHLSLMMWFGYNGKYKEEIDKILKKAGPLALFYLSSDFKFPYGGRSNQYHFNEALIASLFEYEALRYKKLGMLKIAGVFKRSARLAILNLNRWLKMTPPTHIKNFYSTDSGYGTDSYGTYTNYMITMGSFITGAYLFCDEDIEEYTCPCEEGGFVFKTGESFHKIFANCSNYSIEIDTKADLAHDATGLGRIHKKDFPGELALSMPFSPKPKYNIKEGAKPLGMAIGPGWLKDKEYKLATYNLNKAGRLNVEEYDKNHISFSVNYTVCTNAGITEEYYLSSKGLTVESKLSGMPDTNMFYTVPLLYFSGKDYTDITLKENCCTVKLGDNKYTVKWNKQYKATIEDRFLYNRNGQYKVLKIYPGQDSVKLIFTLS